MVKGGSTYRFVTDQLGTVRAVVDVSDGSIVQQIDYDAWGNATLATGSWDVQPFGFAGGLYDSDTGLVRFGARDYDAELGRWTSTDPIRFLGGEANLYEYVVSDPTNSIDPIGLGPKGFYDCIQAGHSTSFCFDEERRGLCGGILGDLFCPDEDEDDQDDAVVPAPPRESGVYIRCEYDYYISSLNACIYTCKDGHPAYDRPRDPNAKLCVDLVEENNRVQIPVCNVIARSSHWCPDAEVHGYAAFRLAL